ncbi:MAG TPA: thiamine pyrophosphate-binding protein [Candidatus Limnocylindrales bacterium]|nr:thiamine pyrophosphate-binding protein [Candidatus Limnocylindrales bacterium]
MERKKRHGGDLIVRALKNEGVELIFALSGGHINPIFDGCLSQGLRIIDTRHEQGALHMAEGWARFTGKPGVAVVTAGPGVVNALPGIAVASQSAAPVVVIAGRSSMARRDLGSMQDVDQLALVRPLVKWARSVYQVERLPEYVATAFRQAVTGRPGPVFLEVPIDIINQEPASGTVRYPTNYCSHLRPQACPEGIKAAAELLAKAERPVILAGSGVWWSGAAAELQAFVEATGIPVYTRTMARGTIPEDHPLAGGFYPLGLMQADVVLVLGTRFDWTVGYGRPPLFNSALKMIQVDIEGGDIGKNRPVEVGLPADIKAVLQQLQAALDGTKLNIDSSWPAMVQVLKAAARETIDEGAQSNAEPIHPARLCRELREFLPRDAAVVADGGDIAGFAVLSLDALSPASLQWVGAFGHLGVGLPFGIAGKLAQPDRPLVVISGDGSLGLSAMEFDTAIRHKIPIVVVVSNDSGWGQIRRVQRQTYGRERVVGCELGIRRYDLMVEALGGFGVYVEKLAELRPALEKAFASGLPACVNVRTDPEAIFTGMDLPWGIH